MKLTSGFSASLSGPDWLKAIRSDAAQNIERLSLPTTESELWRYSRVDEIDLENLLPASQTDLPGELNAFADSLANASALVVVANGSLITRKVRDEAVKVSDASEFTEEQTMTTDVDAFVRLNAAFMPEPVFIDVANGAVVDEPIVVLHWIDGEDFAVFPRIIVRIGEAADAKVVEYFMSSEGTALVAPVAELEVGQAAHATFVSVQNVSKHVRFVSLQQSAVGRDGTLNSTSVAVGGDYARVRTDSRLFGMGSSSKLRAVYVGSDSQMHDFRTLQDHRGPKTTSDLLFKGVVGDTARSVYSGLIRVEKGAAGTNAFQTNRNLVLSNGAHADSVPNLEIEENDVRCSHASAVGPVNEDQLYYLESRGVPTDIAKRLIINGFLSEVVEAIEIPALRDVIKELIGRKLDELAEKAIAQ